MLRSVRTSLPALLLATTGCLPGAVDAGDQPNESPATDSSAATEGASSAPATPGAATRPGPSRTVGRDDSADRVPAVPPALASDPSELARRLTDAGDLVRDPKIRGEDLTAAAFEAQVLYRQLGRRPGWQGRVLSELPPRYRPLARHHLEARRSFRSMHPTLADRVPAWKITPPVPAAKLRGLYRQAEQRHGVDWEILAAVNMVETAFGRISSDSTAGAQGPMQFIPETWARYGEGDVHDPHDAIMAAANHLAQHGAADGNVDDALYAYNNHRAYVAGVKALAAVLSEDPKAFRGLHGWQVLYLSDAGDMWLPVGYDRDEPVPAKRYAAEHPDRHLSTDTG